MPEYNYEDINFYTDILPCLKLAIKRIKKKDQNIIKRSLYEVCITYKLAYYLENALREKKFFKKYPELNLDFEYDKYWDDHKHLDCKWLKKDNVKKKRYVRPDIIIHKRGNIGDMPIDNILIIEFKKTQNSDRDERKTKCFIKSRAYNYKY